MPRRPNTPCRHPGCANLVPYGQQYCETHKPLHPEAVRSAGLPWVWAPVGSEKARHIYEHTHCVQSVLGKGNTPRPRSLTTSNRIEVTRPSSGIGQIGSRFASPATTKRQGTKIKILCTAIEHQGVGGAKSLQPSC